MKKIFSLLFFFTLSVSLFFGNTKNEVEQKEQAKRLMKNQPVKFLENKGQMMDMDGKPVPFVLFKAEAPGVNLFITEEGLTIQTLKIEEEQEKENEDKSSASLSAPSPSNNMGNKDENISIEWERIDVILKGANIKKENISKEGASGTNFNFFYGSTCPKGIYGVKEYEKITIKDVYPGIDWVFYNSNEKGFKYDFVVHPGADYKQIELLYRSKAPIKINAKGEIELTTKHGDITENDPVSFCEEKKITTRFKQNYQKSITINEDTGYETSISFNIPWADSQISPSLREGRGGLIIDPQLVWATFYGGNGDDTPMSIDTDLAGNVFVTGGNILSNFPVQDAGTFFQGTNGGFSDVFILKFNNTGNRLWATYYGGSGSDYGNSISSDVSGNVFVTGYTGSVNFPVQDAGSFFQGAFAGGGDDAFILKFDNTANRLWATYYGGSGSDYGYSISSDVSGNVFVTGHTSSVNFPIHNVGTFFQGTNAGGFDAFILKFDTTGNRLWGTYYGGSDNDLASSISSDFRGNVFVTGYTSSTDFPVQDAGTFFQGTFAGGLGDAFILKFDNIGNRLWATYYGGKGLEGVNSSNFCPSISTDASGNVFVTGVTTSTDFPVQDAGTFFQGTFAGGFGDAFILKFDNIGNRLWATYYGGTNSEAMSTFCNITIDACGKVYIGLYTNSTDFPTQAPSCGYRDNSYNGGWLDIALISFDNAGNRLWATYIGGNGGDFREALAVDVNNNLFLAGKWSGVIDNSTYPLINPGGGAYYDSTFNGRWDDGCILKFINQPSTYSSNQINATACLCNGSATINVSCGNPKYSYVWSNGSSTMNVTNTSNTVTGLCPGAYTVTAYMNCDSIQASYTITGSLPFNTTKNISICSGSSYTLPAGNVVSTAGIYLDTLTSIAGCDSIINTNLTVIPLPTISINNDVTINLGDSTLLITTGGSAYFWFPATKLSSTTDSTTVASPDTTTAYCVEVTDLGCIDTACVTVFVIENLCNDSLFIVPNVFTPNGDGINDTFVFDHRTNCLSDFSFVIYNRWGAELFTSTKGNFVWDGKTPSGLDASNGVYYYTIRLINTNNEEVIRKGFFQLIR